VAHLDGLRQRPKLENEDPAEGWPPTRRNCALPCLVSARSEPKLRARSTRFGRQDGIEETWRVMQPLLDSAPPVHRYEPGSWGPPAAESLTAEYGGWRAPWSTA
jgi:hypothetical protein